jgi:glucokinase
VTSGGDILARSAEPTKADQGPDAVIAQMVSLAAAVRRAAGNLAVAGAGVSSPGPLDTEAGMALGIPTLKGFSDFPFRARLSAALGLPVALENDGIAAAIGEWRHGAGKGVANLVYVTVSTGIGGGVIAGNRVLRGRRGMAGHVGHMSFMAGGRRCFCGNHGCFEAYASGSAFADRAAERAASDNATCLGPDGAIITAPKVFEAAEAGDALALELVAEQARMLGQGFASLLHLYSPDLLIMGGGLSSRFDAMEQEMLASMRASAMPAFRDTPVKKAALGADSGLLGAASLVFARA